MSLLYEVNIEVEEATAEPYRSWLVPHIQEILRLAGFERAQLLRGEKTPGKVRWVVHYWLKDRATLERYLADHAPRLRAQAVAQFGSAFQATRRVLEVEWGAG